MIFDVIWDMHMLNEDSALSTGAVRLFSILSEVSITFLRHNPCLRSRVGSDHPNGRRINAAKAR
jgi:hypothetical protein